MPVDMIGFPETPENPKKAVVSRSEQKLIKIFSRPGSARVVDQTANSLREFDEENQDGVIGNHSAGSRGK